MTTRFCSSHLEIEVTAPAHLVFSLALTRDYADADEAIRAVSRLAFGPDEDPFAAPTTGTVPGSGSTVTPRTNTTKPARPPKRGGRSAFPTSSAQSTMVTRSDMAVAIPSSVADPRVHERPSWTRPTPVTQL